MKVLHINKFGFERGGPEVYLRRLLEKAPSDIELALFAGAPLQLATDSPYPVTIPSFHDVRGLSRAKAAGHVLWSTAVRKALANALDDFSPDVVHLHGYAHQLSPSIVDLLQRKSISTVMTAHDFKLVCPAYVAVRNGHDCFACANRLSIHALADRCLHDSRLWTATALAEAALVRRRNYIPQVIISPSQYMQEQMQAGWLRSKVKHILLRNPVESAGLEWNGNGEYVLYVGRLSREKGIENLIEWCSAAEMSLVIAGDGPQGETLHRAANRTGSDVNFVGHVDDSTLNQLRAGCRVQVLASGWPENAPLSALEAAVEGVPLILSKRGGLPELLTLGARGALIEEETSSGFARALTMAEDNAGDLPRLRESLSWVNHLDGLREVYSTF